MAHRIILLLTISLTAGFAWMVREVPYPAAGQLGDLFSLLTNGSLYGTAIRDLMNFRGAYLYDLWGIFLYLSIFSLILAIGGLWVNRLLPDLPADCGVIRITVQWALGTGSVSILWFLFATMGWLSSNVALPMAALGLGFALYKSPSILIRLRTFRSSLSGWSLTEKIALSFLTVWLIIWASNAFVPETWIDSLVYHLGLPSYYMANRDFRPDPHVIFSYNNQNAQMLYLWSLLMKSEVALKLLNWTFLVMILIALYGFVEKYSNRFCALMAVLMMALLPMTVWQVTYASNDLQMAFGLLMGWILMAQACNAGSETSRNRVLLVSGFCFGIAFGTKTNSLAVILWSFFALMVYLLRKDRGWAQLKSAGFWLGGIGLFSLPWILRNSYYSGNPVYPFFQELMGKSYLKEWHSAEVFVGTMREYVGNPHLAIISNAKELFEVLIGVRFGDTVMYQIGWILGLFLFALAPFLHRGRASLVMRMTTLTALASFWTMSRIVVNPRYALVCFLFLCIPVGVELTESSKSQKMRSLIFALILSNLFFHGTVKNLVHYGFKSSAMTLLGASPERFDFSIHPFSLIKIHEFRAISDFAEVQIGERERVLMIGLYTPYRFDRPFHYSSNLDRQWIDEALDTQNKPGELHKLLIREGFDYILFDRLGWERYFKSHFSRMTQEKIKVLTDFFEKYTEPKASTENYTLLKIAR